MADIKIRFMNETDIEDVAKIEEQCFSMPWSKESLAESIVLPHAVFVVAEYDGAIAGYGGIYITYEDGEITNIAVDHMYRRNGLGQKIVEALVDESVKRKVEAITLEVRESNRSAIHLYEKCGFEKIGIRKNFYEKPVENAIIMLKNIK